MIDIRQIRENPQVFKDGAKAKGFDVDIDRLLEVDDALKSTKQQLQDISTEKNRLGKSIPRLSGDEKQAALARLEPADRSAFYVPLLHSAPTLWARSPGSLLVPRAIAVADGLTILP